MPQKSTRRPGAITSGTVLPTAASTSARLGRLGAIHRFPIFCDDEPRVILSAAKDLLCSTAPAGPYGADAHRPGVAVLKSGCNVGLAVPNTSIAGQRDGSSGACSKTPFWASVGQKNSAHPPNSALALSGV